MLEDMLHRHEDIPEGCVVFPHQVAGHSFVEGKPGILLDNDGKLLKFVQKPPKGEREVNFYRNVFAKDVSDSVTLKLRSFLPAFHGTTVVSNSNLSFQHNYIKLEDLTRKYKKPCVLDIKIGRNLFDHFATQAKREREMRKYSEQEKFGFRIVGMKVYKNDFKTFQFYDKSFGKKLKTHQAIMEGFKKFFCSEDHGNKHVVEILKQCKAIESWFQEQRQFQLFSSSILFVYEGEARTIENGKHADDLEGYRKNCFLSKNPCILSVPQVTVRLVDFAHTYIGSYSEPDTNYLYGLEKLIQCFEELLPVPR